MIGWQRTQRRKLSRHSTFTIDVYGHLYVRLRTYTSCYGRAANYVKVVCLQLAPPWDQTFIGVTPLFHVSLFTSVVAAIVPSCLCAL